MLTLLLAAVLAILGFLCFTGPGGFNGPRHRHSIGCVTTAFSR